MNIKSIVKWLIRTVNKVSHGKVGVIFNIVDDKIEWVQKIKDITEKPVDKSKPLHYPIDNKK